MIGFHCKNCGQKIRAPDKFSGHQVKCPKCDGILSVPATEVVSPLTSQGDSGDLEVGSRHSDLDHSVFDTRQRPETSAQANSQGGALEKTFEGLEAPGRQAGIEEGEQIGLRRLPWFIDIFLYPASFSGLINLAIFIGVPLLIDVLGTFLPVQLHILFGLVSPVVQIAVVLYMYWYIAECIRDTADGGLRAPNIIGEFPELPDMFWQTVNVMGCFVVFSGPFVLYMLFAKRVDVIFWLLLIFAAFFYPMALLAVIRFDSASAFNPRLLIRSITKTFSQYCRLVALFAVGICAMFLLWQKVQQSRPLAFIHYCLSVYLLLVAAHLLGRFYWRYQEKLNWEV
ncbi:MAG: hypothetical protein ACYSTJ_02340 [Planctomycetota bacterium]|jgi:hypothetical protein